jgi:hypothetical protein
MGDGVPHAGVKRFLPRVATKQFPWPKKPFFESGEDSRKSSPPTMAAVDQQRSSVMAALINLIYREFCIARLAEMGKRHLGG